MTGRTHGRFAGHLPWLLLPGVLFLVLLAVSVKGVAINLWRDDEHGYVPFLLALNLALFGYKAKDLRLSVPKALPIPAGVLLLAGCLTYGIGDAQKIMLLEVAGFYLLLVAALLALGGYRLVRQLSFPLLFMLFVIPYPSWVIDYLTIPLKLGISQGSAGLLHALGYPIAQSGVVLALGPYRLLVMDACSGLHSLIYLSALGLLYVHLTGERRRWHRLLLIAAILPIAVVANFIRVLLLLLITYHFGDAVGQGYWHGLAGLMCFLSAFITLYLLDGLLFKLAGRPTSGSEAGGAETRNAPPHAFRLSPARSGLLSAVFLASLLLPYLINPQHRIAGELPIPRLEKLVPNEFSDWKHDLVTDQWLVTSEVTAPVKSDGHQTLARTYINSRGERVMLLISYGSDQASTNFEEHRPEYCYKAQGFTLIESRSADLPLGPGRLAVKRLVAQRYGRFEPITYWMTVGRYPTLPGIGRHWHKLRYALQGLRPDGMLVRVSSISADSAAGFALQSRFIADLQLAVPQALGFKVSS